MLIEDIYMLHVYDPWDHMPFLFLRTGPKSAKKPKMWPLSGLNWPICGRSPGYQTIGMESSLIWTHIPNLRGLRQIFFELSRGEENLCGSGGGVTGLNPKYPRLCLGIQWACIVYEQKVILTNIDYLYHMAYGRHPISWNNQGFTLRAIRDTIFTHLTARMVHF